MPVDRHVYTTRPFVCSECGATRKVLGWDYDSAPRCENGHGPMILDSGNANAAPGVIGDDIPGGYYVKHGLCNPDGTPRRFDSKSEMRRHAAAMRLTQHVEHIPEKGSDKSRHTTRWI